MIEFQVGDIVRCKNMKLESYGLIGKITKLKVNKYPDAVWVIFDTWYGEENKELFFNRCNLEKINEKTDGFSGADIAALVRETQLNALKRMKKLSGIEGIEKENGALFRIEKADFDQSLKTIFKSVSDQDRKRYENIKKIIQESRSHITK